VLPVRLRGHREGAEQGGQGQSSLERRCGVEAVEKSQDSGVRRRGESSGGWWRWRRSPTVSVQKREGEGGLNWGQRWQMGGSDCEAAEAVALRQELERRRGLWWQEPTRRTCSRWRRVGEELELRCGREENGEKRERVVAGGFSSASVAWGIEGEKEGPLRARPHGRGRRRRGGLGRGGR
jgi:hypothetical protein